MDTDVFRILVEPYANLFFCMWTFRGPLHWFERHAYRSWALCGSERLANVNPKRRFTSGTLCFLTAPGLAVPANGQRAPSSLSRTLPVYLFSAGTEKGALQNRTNDRVL